MVGLLRMSLRYYCNFTLCYNKWERANRYLSVIQHRLEIVCMVLDQISSFPYYFCIINRSISQSSKFWHLILKSMQVYDSISEHTQSIPNSHFNSCSLSLSFLLATALQDSLFQKQFVLFALRKLGWVDRFFTAQVQRLPPPDQSGELGLWAI